MIYRRGKKGTFWMRFRFGGRIVHESTKTVKKAIARTAERNRREELEHRWNRIEKRELPPTLTEASKSWLTKRSGLAPGTRETYEAALKHLRAKLGSRLVCEIEAQDITAYQNLRFNQGAAGMAKRYGHIRADVQRKALEGITTAEIQIQRPVHQIGDQQASTVLSERTN